MKIRTPASGVPTTLPTSRSTIGFPPQKVQSAYLELLPPHVQDLVRSIEAFAGREIEVKVDARPVSPRDPNPDRLAAEVNEQHAVIFLREPKSFPPEAVIHEL